MKLFYSYRINGSHPCCYTFASVDISLLYRSVHFTFGLLGCVRYNEDFATSRFVELCYIEVC